MQRPKTLARDHGNAFHFSLKINKFSIVARISQWVLIPDLYYFEIIHCTWMMLLINRTGFQIFNHKFDWEQKQDRGIFVENHVFFA